jgi:conjugal transfer pilus assembly protein TraK
MATSARTLKKTRFSNWKMRGMLVVATLMASKAALALQSFEVRDGATVSAKISIKDTSRIKVDGQLITDVFGDVRSANGTGRLVVTADEAKGELFVRPVQDSGGGPIHVFVSTAKGSYGLLLLPSDIPADTVVLRDRSIKATDNEAVAKPSSGYVRQLKQLAVALASDRLDALQITEVNRTVRLWNEVDYTHLRDVGNGSCTASQYHLREKQGKPIVLDEREFYTSGVAAVAIERLELPAYGSTHIYVIQCGTAGRR